MMRRTAGMLLALLLCAGEARAQLTTDALIDSLQRRSFLFFWNEANPSNGLMRDRSQSGSPCSIASEGFGLSAIAVAIDHGWITRDQGRQRVLAALQTFWNGPQGSGSNGFMGYQGLYYHFLDMTTGLRVWSSELSTIDTALLFAGILDVRQYFNDPDDPTEMQIRALGDSITQRANWPFMTNPATHGIKMGWNPEGTSFGDWVGYNEAMILHVIAFGSPTHPADSLAWVRWTSGYQWSTQFGQTYVIFPPLFGHQYSHCWIDFSPIWDAYMHAKGITYAENSRRATYAQRQYSITNPLHRTAYGDSMWGLTAGDGPNNTYVARGAPPTQNDDGTLSPTAPASSIPFAPEICIPVIRNMYTTYKVPLWGKYGFLDAFNPGVSWYDTDWLGIDEGPIVLMIENWRNGAVWQRMKQSPDITRGLQRAGFTAVNTAVLPPGPTLTPDLLWAEPNPFAQDVTVRYRMPAAGRVRLAIYDVRGREVARLADGLENAGFHERSWTAPVGPAGVYFARFDWNGRTALRKLVRLH